MTEDQSGKPDDLEVLKKLDAIGEEFETAWNAGDERPAIDAYLQKHHGVPADQLLLELVSLEVELRLKAGEVPRAVEYSGRFPELDRDWLAKVIVDNTALTASLRQDSDPDATFVRSNAPANGDDSEQSTLAPSGQSNRTQSTTKFTSFGDYEIIDEIARGGMGVVYQARQKSLNRVVALKMILSGQLAGEEEIQRFRSEAEAAANLDHPGIVPVYEIGEHEGHQFFSMGFVEGSSLQNKIIDGPLPGKEAAELCKKVAEAISYAHGKGVIHRDLKPANVLLDQNGEPKVTDFGLAKRIDSDSDLTRTTQAMGSPSWMPPEQASGKSATVDARADVYALGAILYNLITGRPPFQAANHLDTMMQVLEKEPVRPRTLDPKIPVDLETITLKCLEKDPDKRYQSSKDFSDELTRFINGEPIHARPIGRVARTWRWCKRKPMATAAMVLSIALVLAIGAGSSIFAVMESNRADEAVRNKEAQARLTKEANDAKDKAEQNKTLAENQRDLAHRNLYAAHINAIKRAYDEGNIAYAIKLLERYIPIDESTIDLREFEWHYLNRLCRMHVLHFGRTNSSYYFAGHSIEFSADGKHLAICHDFGEIDVIKIASGEVIGRLKDPAGTTSICFHPNGKELVTGSSDGCITRWDVTSGAKLSKQKVIDHFPINSIDIDKAGKTVIAAASHDGFIDLVDDPSPNPDEPRQSQVVAFDLESNEVTFNKKQSYVSISFWCSISANGKYLAYPDAEGVVVQNRNDNSSSILEMDNPECATFSPDGSYIATADGNDIKIWELESRTIVDAIKGLNGFVTCLSFSDDGRKLAAAGNDNVIRIWDLLDSEETLVLKGHRGTHYNDRIVDLCFSSDGWRLASIANNGEAFVWDALVDRSNASVSVDRQFDQVRFSQTPPGIVTIADSNRFEFWDLESQVRLSTCLAPKELFSSFTIVPKQKAVAIVSDDVRIFDSRNGKELSQFLIDNGQPTQFVGGEPFFPAWRKVHFTSDGNWLAIELADSIQQVLWDRKSANSIDLTMLLKKELIEVDQFNSPHAVAFSKNDQLFAFSIGKKVFVVDLLEMKIVQSFMGHSDNVNAIVFSFDGKLLASGSQDKSAIIWDVETAKKVRGLAGLTEGVMGVAFSPSGKRIVTQTSEHVNLWDVITGEQLLRLDSYVGDRTGHIEFSFDGKMLTDGSQVWSAHFIGEENNERLCGNTVALLSSTYDSDFNKITEKIRQDETIDDATKRWAMRIAKYFVAQDVYLERLKDKNETIRNVLVDQNGSKLSYSLCLQQTDNLISHSNKARLYSTHAFALYRSEELDKAKEILEKSIKRNSYSFMGETIPIPTDVALLVMIHVREGQLDQAQSYMNQLDEIMAKPLVDSVWEFNQMYKEAKILYEQFDSSTN